jgi:hypothetical protein
MRGGREINDESHPPLLLAKPRVDLAPTVRIAPNVLSPGVLRWSPWTA